MRQHVNTSKGYSVGHEQNVCLTGEDRFSYPDNHIEVDNRLSWLLGRLDSRHDSSTFYVHLTRDPKKVFEYLASSTPILGIGPSDSAASEILVACNRDAMVSHRNADLIAERCKDFFSQWDRAASRVKAMNI